MDHERFKNLASGIQSVAIVIGIAVGGIWALYTFKALGTANRAQAEINKTQAEISEIERRNIEQPVLAIEVKGSALTSAPDKAKAIYVEAKFRNDGKRILNVEFTKPTLLVSRIDKDGRPAGSPSSSTEPGVLNEQGTLEEVGERVLRPNQSRNVPFVVPVSSPGLYLVQIKAIYSGIKLENGALVRSLDEPIQAFTQTIIEVP